MGYANEARVATPKVDREVEGLIMHARRIREASGVITDRLADVRRRLLGESEPQSGEKTSGPKEVISSELVDLRNNLHGIDTNLEELARHVEALERV